MSSSVVEDWIRYHSEDCKASDPPFSVCEYVDDLVTRDPEAGWLMILDLIAAAPDDRVLAAIAAGPLEDLAKRSPELFVDRIEIQARRDAKFRRCFTGVWGTPPVIQKRLAKYVATVTDPL